MQFKKGEPRPLNSGRKKGSKNIKKAPRILAYMTENDIHPLVEVMKLMPELDPIERARLWMELASYCEAKPKFKEAVSDDEDPLMDEMPEEQVLKLVDRVP